MLEKLTLNEIEIINIQRRLYSIGKTLNNIDMYDYRRSELNASYAMQILDPFLQQTEQNNAKPCILDLGAGKGDEGAYMESKGIRTIKMDLTKICLKDKKDSIQAIAWRLPFTNALFDGIHSKDMITHIPPEFRLELFSELNRVTKPGGIVLICSVNESKRGFYQYPTFMSNLEEHAQNSGFIVQDRQEWRSTDNFKDWYKAKCPRFILKLKNNPMPARVNL